MLRIKLSNLGKVWKLPSVAENSHSSTAGSLPHGTPCEHAMPFQIHLWSHAPSKIRLLLDESSCPAAAEINMCLTARVMFPAGLQMLQDCTLPLHFPP